jgi:hypothetical protein
MRFSLTRLATGPSCLLLSLQALALDSGRSPQNGADKPQQGHYSRWPAPWSVVRLPAFPSPEVMLSSGSVGTVTGSDSSRWAYAPREEGLSSSWSHCAHVPSPIRRRVLGGCASKVFPTSLAFAHAARARLPLVPRGCPLGLTSRCGSVRLMLRTVRLLAHFLGLCQRASPAGFRQLRYLGAAQLPGSLAPTGTGLSPASLIRLIWTHAARALGWAPGSVPTVEDLV